MKIYTSFWELQLASTETIQLFGPGSAKTQFLVTVPNLIHLNHMVGHLSTQSHLNQTNKNGQSCKKKTCLAEHSKKKKQLFDSKGSIQSNGLHLFWAVLAPCSRPGPSKPSVCPTSAALCHGIFSMRGCDFQICSSSIFRLH